MDPSNDPVDSLWRLCAVLRKDGVTCQQYVMEFNRRLTIQNSTD